MPWHKSRLEKQAGDVGDFERSLEKQVAKMLIENIIIEQYEGIEIDVIEAM